MIPENFKKFVAAKNITFEIQSAYSYFLLKKSMSDLEVITGEFTQEQLIQIQNFYATCNN